MNIMACQQRFIKMSIDGDVQNDSEFTMNLHTVHTYISVLA
jgi:hypothetical protein